MHFSCKFGGGPILPLSWSALIHGIVFSQSERGIAMTMVLDEPMRQSSTTISDSVAVFHWAKPSEMVKNSFYTFYSASSLRATVDILPVQGNRQNILLGSIGLVSRVSRTT